MVEFTNKQNAVTQQINTFTSGMNLDIDDSLLPDSAYREAYNLRLTADVNGNTGSLHSIEGVEFFQNITTNLPDAANCTDIHVVHTDSIRQYGIVIVKAIKATKQYYYIFRFVNKNEMWDESQGLPKLIFGACPTPLGDNISSVVRYEDDDNIKFYYADGTQPLRVINISPAADSTRPATDDGAFGIYPTALLSQPEFIGLASGNLKVGAYQYGYQLANKNGAETEVSSLTQLIYTTASTICPASSQQIQGSEKGQSSNKSIKLRFKVTDPKYDRIRIVSLFYETTTDQPLIQILRDIKLVQKEDGTVDDVIFQDIDNKGISIMTTEEFNLITSIHFIPKILESKNNHLFASNIQYQDNTFDVNFDARSYSYCLNAQSELLAILRDQSGKPEIKTTRASILGKQTIVPTDHDSINPYSIIEKNHATFKKVVESNTASADAKCAFRLDDVDPTRIVYGGEGLNVSYKLVTADILESTKLDATDFEGVWTCNVTSDGTLVNSKFLKLTDKVRTVPGYGDSIISSKLKSLQRDEVYRFSIVCYNKYNQASPAKWIADVRMPAASEGGFETFIADRTVCFLSDSSQLVSLDPGRAIAVRPLGIEFKVKNLPSDVVAYEIVRCRRTDGDRATITQGIIGTTYVPREGVGSSDVAYASEFMMATSGCAYDYTWNQNYYNGTSIMQEGTRSGDSEVYMIKRMSSEILHFASPEVSYNYEFMKSRIPTQGINLQMVNFLFPDGNQRGNAIYTIEGKIREFEYDGGFPTKRRVLQVPMFRYYKKETYDQLNREIRIPLTLQATEAIGLGEVNLGGELPSVRGDSTTGQYSPIRDVAFPPEGAWNKYDSKLDYITSVGGQVFNNWIISSFRITGDDKQHIPYGYEGSNGRCLILSASMPGNSVPGLLNVLPRAASSKKMSRDKIINGQITTNRLEVAQSYYNDSIIGTLLCNIRGSIIPYGGYTYSARQFNTYMGIGGYKQKSDDVLTIFPGDTYINLFEYVKTHYAARTYSDGNVDDRMETITTIYFVPTESSINLSLRTGKTYEKSQIEPANVENKFVQDKPLYVYNSVYSVEPTARVFTPQTLYDEYNKLVDTRTVFSLNKNNDETIDSWTKFKPLNFIDVDSRYGQITNLRTFGNELLFWQSGAVGKFSVNERTLITDDSNSPLMLGTGGVLSRYDYLATVNGLKAGHNDSDCQSDSVLYWYDYDKHELCAYQGGQVVCISKAKFVQSYLNKLAIFKDKQINKPFLTFDKKYNEIIATLAKDESIIYNEASSVFTGFYNIAPDSRLYFNNDVYFTKDDKLYIYNGNVRNTGFGDQSLPINLNYIVNKDYQRTKVFDNIDFTGYLNKDLITFNFKASNLASKPLQGSGISDRELNFRAAIPRVSGAELFGNRMRGRVLTCNVDYKLGNPSIQRMITFEDGADIKANNTEQNIITNNYSWDLEEITTKGFELPYIRTTYRISNS